MIGVIVAGSTVGTARMCMCSEQLVLVQIDSSTATASVAMVRVLPTSGVGNMMLFTLAFGVETRK